jgi:hypothetical protein
MPTGSKKVVADGDILPEKPLLFHKTVAFGDIYEDYKDLVKKCQSEHDERTKCFQCSIQEENFQGGFEKKTRVASPVSTAEFPVGGEDEDFTFNWSKQQQGANAFISQHCPGIDVPDARFEADIATQRTAAADAKEAYLALQKAVLEKEQRREKESAIQQSSAHFSRAIHEVGKEAEGKFKQLLLEKEAEKKHYCNEIHKLELQLQHSESMEVSERLQTLADKLSRSGLTQTDVEKLLAWEEKVTEYAREHLGVGGASALNVVTSIFAEEGAKLTVM